MTQKHNSDEKYAYLYKLSHEKLMELLFSAPIPATNPEDEAYVDALEEAILAKENEAPTGLLPNVDQQWLEFQKYYCVADKRDNTDLLLEPAPLSSEAKSPVHRIKKRRLCRTVAIAAVIAALIALTVPVALGYVNIFEMIGQWTDDYFHFAPANGGLGSLTATSSIAAPQNTEFNTPKDALNAYGVKQSVLPNWYPNGFSLSESSVFTQEAANMNEFTFLYSNTESAIVLSFTQHVDSFIGSNDYQKDVGPVQEYRVNNIVHYLYTNAGQSCASWYIENVECSINGDISMEELKEMIDSIYI